ncbi:MAG: type II restriction endonuclease [Prevotella sp.]|nr:type II restriction endonuclease [Prevotella sp.]
MNNAHTKEQYDEFMSQLLDTNATLDYFCDFEKISRNVNAVSIKLHQLNYLIGKEDMEAAIRQLWQENNNVFTVLDILIAVRRKDNKKSFDKNGDLKSISSFFDSPEGVIEFIEDTGLKEVFKNKQITNLVDYVFGVETGLDTNARKNRGGDIMEKTVARIFSKNAISYKEQVSSTDYDELSVLGVDLKRFDFVIETKTKTYFIEVNFYSSNGSKLNEVARSYSDIAPKINSINGFEFVWITDGKGWLSAKNKLEEAYNIIPSTYNLTNIGDFIKLIKE